MKKFKRAMFFIILCVVVTAITININTINTEAATQNGQITVNHYVINKTTRNYPSTPTSTITTYREVGSEYVAPRINISGYKIPSAQTIIVSTSGNTINYYYDVPKYTVCTYIDGGYGALSEDQLVEPNQNTSIYYYPANGYDVEYVKIGTILTKNPCYTAGRKIDVKGLMLHSVGCSQPRASAFINSWNSPTFDRACVHGFIDGNDGTVYQTLPWNHRGWHCGSSINGSGNNTHIGVEMCEPACITYTGGATFKCSDVATAKAVVTRDVMDKVKAELEKRATGLGRVFEPKEKTKRKVQKAFYFGNAETRFQDPYKQAEYLYGLIEGVQMNG